MRKTVSGIMLALLLACLVSEFSGSLIKETVATELPSAFPLVYVYPEFVTADVGETFTINVIVCNLTPGWISDPDSGGIISLGNLYGIDIQLTWDPSIIKYVSHVKTIPVEYFPEGILHSLTIPLKDDVDETASMPNSELGTRYWLAEASMQPAAVFNGEGTIFTMTFTVLKPDETLIEILSCTLADNLGNMIGKTYLGRWLNPPRNCVVNPPNQPPEANFAYSPLKPLIGEETTFDASASYDPDGGTIVNYQWVFYIQTGSIEDPPVYLLPTKIIEGEDKRVVTHSFTDAQANYVVELTVTDDEGTTDRESRTVKATEDWTFAIITDLHMGYYYEDYGTLSWDDAVSDGNYQLTTRLSTIVNWINEHEESNNIHFVVVLGDISDSGEKSELLKARDILNGLNVPYIPIIGNHDIWPYTQDEGKTKYWRDKRFTTGSYPTISDYAETAIGDEYFDEVFWQQNINNREKIEELFGSSFRRQEDPVEYAYVQNYVFTYKKIKFIALDFIDRSPSPEEEPQSSGARLNDDTEHWLSVNLARGEETILLSHHPMFYDLARTGFSYYDAQIIGWIIESSGSVVLKNFAGHTHRNAESKGWATEIEVVTTEAVCRESCSTNPALAGDRSGKGIRLVSMTWDARLKDYNSLVPIGDRSMDIPHPWYVGGMCPIDLTVTDPDGFTITKEAEAVAGMFYLEDDWDGDGDSDDLIFLDDLKSGDYLIQVIPESGALPNETYTLRALGSDAVTVLAENVLISDIPTEPYIVNSTVFSLNIPPTTLIEIGEPKIVNDTTYVSPATPIDLIASDNPYGSGLASTIYRIYNATFDTGWIIHTQTIYLTGLSDGTYQIDYYSIDYLNNTEPTNTATAVLVNPPAVVTATIDIQLQTLNVRSVGVWITAYTELPEGYNVVDINISSVTLNSTIPIDTEAPTAIGDYDEDGVAELMVKFNRTQVVEYMLSEGIEFGNVTLTLTGKLCDDTPFEASSIMKISALAGDVNCDGKTNILDIVQAVASYGSKEGQPNWNPNANFASPYNRIDILDIVTIAYNYGKTYP